MLHPTGQLTHTKRSDGAPEPDGGLQTVVRHKIRHYHQFYLSRPDPIAFMSVSVDTSDRIYDDLSHLLFFKGSVSRVDFGEGIGHEDFYTV